MRGGEGEEEGIGGGGRGGQQGCRSSGMRRTGTRVRTPQLSPAPGKGSSQLVTLGA